MQSEGPPVTRFLMICGLMLALATPPVAATSEVDRADIMRLLSRLFTGVEMREDLQSLGFRGEKLDIAMAHIGRTMSDPVVSGFIADQVLAAQAGTADMAGANGVLWQLIDRGAGHLPPRDLHYYFKVQRTVLYALPTRDCGRLIRGRMPVEEMSDLTSRTAARLNAPALETYYNIQLKAARLGATRAPNILPPARRARIEERISDVLGARLAVHPDGPAIQAAFGDIERAANPAACAAGRLFLDSVLSLEGPDLTEGLIYLSMP